MREIRRSIMASTARIATALLLAALAGPGPAAAQLQQRDEQFYLPGGFNWKFLDNFPEGARLFNAFDYGHAVLYETLLTKRGPARARTLDREYEYLTTDLLVRPPRFAVVEEAVMPGYAKIAWRAKQMFEWAHVLHRQIYDIYADPDLARARQDSLIEQVTDYYLTRSEYAFVPVPKSMALMDEQYYSQAFRRDHAKFNGLIWAYHWLQVGLYEPFIDGRTPDETKAGVQATIARFWSMLEDPPTRLPGVMPMTSAVAPRFSAAHPRAAVIFDNLHMMHDIISDILASDTVPASRKSEVIDRALDEFQDSARNVISIEAWRNMADHMGGVGGMGGPAVGILQPIKAGPAAREGHQGHAMPAGADSTAVTDVIRAFHERLAAGDSAGVLRLLTPEVMILEGGAIETLDEYRSHHLANDIAASRSLAGEREIRLLTVNGDAAWVTSSSRMRGAAQARAPDLEGAELIVLTRQQGEWRIAAIHWSSRRRRE